MQLHRKEVAVGRARESRRFVVWPSPSDRFLAGSVTRSFFIGETCYNGSNLSYSGALNRSKMRETVTCFMDMVDFEEELGNAMKGNKIFPTIEDLRREKPCTKQCGIVEVQVSLVRVVQEQDFSESIARARARTPEEKAKSKALRMKHPHEQKGQGCQKNTNLPKPNG